MNQVKISLFWISARNDIIKATIPKGVVAFSYTLYFFVAKMNHLHPGKFITLEGPDCSGKSSNVPVLAEAIRSLGYEVVITREPGGTELAEKIRNLILHNEMDGTTEIMLFLAARRHHVQTKILPALKEGKFVISDRFYDSTYAYQGHARGLSKDLDDLHEFVSGGIIPDYTLFFDLSFEESVKRLALRTDKQDRLDKEEENFRRLVHEGYQKRLKPYHADTIVSTIPEADLHDAMTVSNDKTFRFIYTVDANCTPEKVADQVKGWVYFTFPQVTK